MPAVSKAQQRFFGMIHGLKTGKLKLQDLPSGLASKVKKASSSMSDKTATDFAKTKTKGLPAHVTTEDFDVNSLTFKHYMLVEFVLQEYCEHATDSEFEALEEKWAHEYETPASKKGMFQGVPVAHIKHELSELKRTGPHKVDSPEYTRMKELQFALRAKYDWSGDK